MIAGYQSVRQLRGWPGGIFPANTEEQKGAALAKQRIASKKLKEENNMRGSCTKLGTRVLLVGLAVSAVPAKAQGEFPLKDGDTWVMIGDSITAQHLHSNYFEAFCYARFPKMTFCFRNSGVGGDTIPKALARFEWDAAAWKPTVVSVELGMNDAGGFTPEKFIEGMGTLVNRIRAINARPVILTSSPVNNGNTTAKLDGHTARLQQYALALKDFTAKQGIPFADQFSALVDFWAKNKPRENLANALNTLRGLVGSQPDLLGVEHLKAFMAVWSKAEKQPVTMLGDPVHSGPPGQLTMAAALLAGLNAPRLVSKATIDVGKGELGETAQCKIEKLKADGGNVAFDRLDEALPFPVPDEARPVLTITDSIANLSQCLLTVTGLKAEQYDVAIDGVKVATVTAADLAKGWNMGTLDKGAIADQCRTILQLVAAKEGMVGQWRNVSRAAALEDAAQKEQLAKLTQQVQEADAKIREAAQPKSHHFELTPAK